MNIKVDESTARESQLKDLTLESAILDEYDYVVLKDAQLNDPYYDKKIRDLKLTDTVTTADYEVDDGIPESSIDLRTYLSDYIKTDDDFMILVKLLETVFNDIKSIADNFNNLSDVDNVVEIFLPKLAYLVNYKYNYNIPADVNRDLIKRMIWLYGQKGRDYDILNAANYGNNDKWVGSTLFLPNATPDKHTASLYYPIDYLFTHDVSTHSGTHRYQDSTRYRDGVLIITVVILTDKIREAVRKVVPAGIRIYYDVDSSMEGDSDKGVVDFGEWVLHEDYELDYRLRIFDNIRSNTFSGTDIYSPHRLSGKQVLFFDRLIDILKGISFIPNKPADGSINTDIQYPIGGTELTKTYIGVPKRSVNAGRSGKYRYSGEVNVIQVQAPIEEVHPTDTYYPVSAIENLVPSITQYNSQYEDSIGSTENNSVYLKSYCEPVVVTKTTEPTSKPLSEYKLTDFIDTGYELRKLSEMKLTDIFNGSPLSSIKLDQLVKTYKIIDQ